MLAAALRRQPRRPWWALSQFLAAVVIAFGVATGRYTISLAAAAALVAVMATLIWRPMTPPVRFIWGLAGMGLVIAGTIRLPLIMLLIVAANALYLFAFVVPTWLSPTVLGLAFSGEIWSASASLGIHLAAWAAVSAVALGFGVLAEWHKQFERERRTLSTASGELSQTLMQAEYLAFHDALTGLPNRRLLTRRLEEHVERIAAWGGFLAVAFIDLDQFKELNDGRGHAFGDRVLKTVAAALNHGLEADDVLGRQGGDEFILILNSVANEEEAGNRIEGLRRTLAEGLKIDSIPVEATASFGVAVYPENGDSPDELLRHADLALYRAKEAGRNRIVFYSREWDQSTPTVTGSTSPLHKALLASEFYLVFQPQVDILTGRTTGIEALIRWHGDDRSLTLPEAFLPEAQQVGLMKEIDEWVLMNAMQALERMPWWRQQPMTLGVNISGASLESPDFIPRVLDLLHRHSVAPARLELEITESLLSRHHGMAAMRLGELRQNGIGVAIDDFAMGAASFAYLQHFPATRLTIHRSLAAGLPHSDSIPRAIVAVAKSLSLDVMAEGVETRDQAERLLQLGCDTAQGFYYSPPVELNDVQPKYRIRRAENPA